VLGFELDLLVGGLLLRGVELLLEIVVARIESRQPLALVARAGPESLVVEFEDLHRLARLGEVALETADDGIGLLRLAAHGHELVGDDAHALPLGGELPLQVVDLALLLLEGGAQGFGLGLLLAQDARRMLELRGDDGVIVGQLLVGGGELAHLPPHRRAAVLLVPQELLGLEELGLHEGVVGDDRRDGIDHERIEIVLQPGDVVQPLEHLVHADADHLALAAGRIQDLAGDQRALVRRRGRRPGRGRFLRRRSFLAQGPGYALLPLLVLPREEPTLDRDPGVFHDANPHSNYTPNPSSFCMSSK
jgi:hypothetical protein